MNGDAPKSFPQRESLSGPEVALAFVGMLFILLGLLCNEWLMAKVFAPDGRLTLVNRAIIWLFDLSAIAAGVFLVRLPQPIRHRARLLERAHPHLVNWGIGFSFTAILLVGIEEAFWCLNQRNRVEGLVVKENATGEVHYQEPVLGYRGIPNFRCEISMEYARKPVFDVVYTLDEHGRRTTIGCPTQSDTLALFMGDSFTFGLGVNDDQTLPSCVGRTASSCTATNYGFNGYGPQHVLAKLQSEEIPSEISGDYRRVCLIYTFIDSHLDRAFGSFKTSLWLRYSPRYVINRKKELVRLGSLIETRPILTRLYIAAHHLQIIKYLNPEYPWRTEKHVRLTARIIEESCAAFKTSYPDGEFILLIYPGAMWGRRLIPLLNQTQVKVLDYSEFLDTQDVKYRLAEVEGHPSALAYELVAGKLVQDLGL